MRILLITTLPAFVAAICLTPLFRRLAARLGVVDHPDKHRKLHSLATPLGGGVAVLLAITVTVLVATTFSPSRRAEFAVDAWFLIGGLVAAFIICAIGLIDDWYGLRGRQKLVGQFLAAGLWLATGLWIDKLHLFGVDIDLGILAVPFTLFWLMGALNAFNLMDGADGLAAIVGIALSIAIAVMATLTGHPTEAFLALAMAGALAGFLVYNSPPASIFLGDAGSMMIGLMLGGLAIRSSLTAPATVALAALVAIWSIPFLDVTIAILRRTLTGRSIYSADHGHLHHIAQQHGFRGWTTALAVGFLSAFTAAAAVVSIHLRDDALAVGATCIVFFTLIASGFFGRHECLLLVRRAKHFIRTLLPYAVRRNHHGEQLQMRIQGTHRWEELWESLTRFAERFGLSSIQLNVSMPSIDEEYFATWQRKDHPSDWELWTSRIPLFVGNVSVGRLSIVAACHRDDVCTRMSDLIIGLNSVQDQLEELIRDSAVEETEARSGDSLMANLTASRQVLSGRRGRDLKHTLHAPEDAPPKPARAHNVDGVIKPKGSN